MKYEILDEQEINNKGLNYKWMRILGVMMGIVGLLIIPISIAVLHDSYANSYIHYDKIDYFIIFSFSLIILSIVFLLLQISYKYLKLDTSDKLIIEVELNRIYKKRNIVSLLSTMAIILFIINDFFL